MYHALLGTSEYLHYDNIILADTFNITEDKAALSYEELEENNERILRQQKSTIRVIIGNPPYSVAKSVPHKGNDESLEKTYAAKSSAALQKSLHDSYIQAFRWASDRLAETKEGGIIAFISNGGWLDGNAMDGMRKCFRREFSDIYVFNLRGNQRTSGELSRKEGGKIFGSGSRAGITITFLVKTPAKAACGKYSAQIHYCDIGDYLSQKEKLERIKNFKSVSNEQMQWQQIVPNAKEDWINQRDGLFDTLILIGDKKADKSKAKQEHKQFFNTFYNGMGTSRDAWVYNSSVENLTKKIEETVNAFNNQYKTGKKETNPQKLSWSSNLDAIYEKGDTITFEKTKVASAVYRPFFKQNIYIGEKLIHRPAIQKVLFPTPKHENLVIGVCGVGSAKDFSCLITNQIPDLEFVSKSQCFPLYYYTEQKTERDGELFDDVTSTENNPQI